MADSDDEYDRKRGRDKFRRERNDYDHRRDDRRRESWEGDRYRGGSRNRRDWSNNRDRGRDSYGRDYDRGYRDRGYSPRREMSPPHPKRMRRDWDDGGYPPYDMPHYGGPPPRGPPPNWGPGPDMGPPPQGGFGGGPGPNVPDPDFPTQPPMMTFKAFLASQDDTISDQDAIKKYNEYKEDFKRQQINEFFLAHKDEECYTVRYHLTRLGLISQR